MANSPQFMIGHHRVERVLAQGGMATVYLARDPDLDRYVAIKVIRSDQYSSTDFLQRFEREAKLAGRLPASPNIVTVHEYGVHQGNPYLVMEYVSGGTLKDRMGAPMPYQQASAILAPVARALEMVHETGIMHRDIKPGNILFSERGVPKLTDFGIAKALQSTMKDLTTPDTRMGTPEYMAPEQISNQQPDHRVDIYALGVVFYELVTGCKPFPADTPMAVLAEKMTKTPLRAIQCLPGLPPQVDGIIMRAMDKDPAMRFQTAGEFAAALESLARGQLVSLPPVPPAGRQTVMIQPEQPAMAGASPAMSSQPAVTRTWGQQVPSSQPVAQPVPKKAARGIFWILAASGAVVLIVVAVLVALLVLKPTASAPGTSPTAASSPVVIANPATPTPVLPTETRVSLDYPTPTAAPTSTPEPTATPAPTALPGAVVLDISQMKPSIPWLPAAAGPKPAIYYIGFNLPVAPFDNPLVRKAFALAIDRKALITQATGRFASASPATTFIPGKILGRDLYGEIGYAFDPARAKDLLAQAGFPGGQSFPPLTLDVTFAADQQAVGKQIAAMLRDTLGVTVTIHTDSSWDAMAARVRGGQTNLFLDGWVADESDPHNFMNDNFLTADDLTGYKREAFSSLLKQALDQAADPAARQILYIQAERLVCEEDAAVVPLMVYSK